MNTLGIGPSPVIFIFYLFHFIRPQEPLADCTADNKQQKITSQQYTLTQQLRRTEYIANIRQHRKWEEK